MQSKSEKLLEVYTETLRDEIRQEEKEKAEKLIFEQLPSNDLKVYIRQYDSINPLKGKGFNVVIVIKLNGKEFLDEFFITEHEMKDYSDDATSLTRTEFENRIKTIVSEIFLKSLYYNLKPTNQ